MPTPKKDQPETISGAALLTRVAWLVVGNLVLLAAAAVIARDDLAPLSLWSGVFWLTVLASIGLRYLDITRYTGLTSDGERATLTDWKRYSVGLTLLAAMLWSVALLA